MGCLEIEPARRPPSALAVAASLPGGDRLAALVAAGETPPPEMVAAAGEKARVSSRFAFGALALVLAGMPLAVHAIAPLLLLSAVPLEKAPEVLADRASELAIRLERPPARPGAATGSGMRTASPPRTPPRPRAFPHRLLVSAGCAPAGHDQPAGDRFPARSTTHRARHGDGDRRHARAPRLASVRGRAGPVGAEAFLGRRPLGRGPRCGRMRPVPPSRLSPSAPTSGARGKAPRRSARARRRGSSRRRARLAGSGRPRAGRAAGAAPPARVRFRAGLFRLDGGRPPPCRRNMPLGRGDRRGAGRLAATVFGLRMAAWTLQATHTTVLPREQDLFMYALARALYGAAIVWVLYVAIEPTVRRHWPGILISWSRVLGGRLRDPRRPRPARREARPPSSACSWS